MLDLVANGASRELASAAGGVAASELDRLGVFKIVTSAALLEKGDMSAPACNNCHGNHGAVPPKTRDISVVCSNCHGREGELLSARDAGTRHGFRPVEAGRHRATLTDAFLHLVRPARWQDRPVRLLVDLVILTVLFVAANLALGLAISALCSSQQQALLLDVLWRLLGNDGKLLYATCSVFQEENSFQIAHFLERHPDARCSTPPGTRPRCWSRCPEAR